MTQKASSTCYACVEFFVLLLLLSHAQQTHAQQSAYYPSFLLLNNWVNQSVWISTGIPVPNSTLNGIPSYPPSIRNVFDGKLGLLNMSVVFKKFQTIKAFLGMNNSVSLVSDIGAISVYYPPNTTCFIVLSKLTRPIFAEVLFGKHLVSVNRKEFTQALPSVYLFSNSSYVYTPTNVSFSLGFGVHYLEVCLDHSSQMSVEELLNYDEHQVSRWLSESLKPAIPKSLLKEYYLSLLLLVDDQNPYYGFFAASPSPVYLYAWVRDSEFSALALELSGHTREALKFWTWLANAPRLQGYWYTRYDFYNAKPDYSYALPELDSTALFEIGVYQYYEVTHDKRFLDSMLVSLNECVSYQLKQIEGSAYALLPEDLSVWEDRFAYHFWTEAFNDLGLKDAIALYKLLGINTISLQSSENSLNLSILEHFWNNGFFASALTQSVVFSNGTSTATLEVLPPALDSSTLLPVAFGYIQPSSQMAKLNAKHVTKELKVDGGLARFPGDDYHYTQYLYDSTSEDPPWAITTLFQAIFEEKLGNYSEALALLRWCAQHSEQGLLPEAVDPNSGAPLPTTSPLTWSSAMFVIASLGLPKQEKPQFIWLGIIITFAILLYIVKRITKKSLKD